MMFFGHAGKAVSFPPDVAKFAQFRLITGSTLHKNGCQLWDGNVNGKGYGTMRIGRKVYYVHRLAYLFMVGPLVDGQQVHHSCDNRRCMNPEHLFMGTPKDNHTDMRAKGRAYVFGQWLPPEAFCEAR